MLNLAVVITILISTIFHVSLGYSSGAPTSQCGDMTPSHGVNSQPAETSPYSVKVGKPYYMPGENVRVSIESSSNDTIKGFLIQARQVGENVSVGSFPSAPAGGKLLNCGNEKGAVTHSTRLNVKKVTFEWEPLISLSGNISFFATVVRDRRTFWVKLESPELCKRELPGPSQTVQSSAIRVSQTSVSLHSQMMQTTVQPDLSYRVTEPKETSSPSSTIQSIRIPEITISRFSNFQHMPATSRATLNSRVPKSIGTSMFTPIPIADSTVASIISMASPARITNPISFPKAVSLALKTSKMSSLPNDTNSRVTKPAEISMSTPIPIADSTPVQMISTASPIHKANSTFSVRVVSSTSTTSKTSCQYNDAKCDRAQINHGAMFAFFIALILVFWQNAVLI